MKGNLCLHGKSVVSAGMVVDACRHVNKFAIDCAEGHMMMYVRMV